MREYHFLPETSEKLTHENLSQLGYELSFDNDQRGYSISSPIGTLYGLAFQDKISTFYPGRSIGKWQEMLKEIDKVVNLEFYDDGFNDEWCHSNWTEEVTEQRFRREVAKNRRLLGLPIGKK